MVINQNPIHEFCRQRLYRLLGIGNHVHARAVTRERGFGTGQLRAICKREKPYLKARIQDKALKIPFLLSADKQATCVTATEAYCECEATYHMTSADSS